MNNTASTDTVSLEAELFDAAFEPTFGPFDGFSSDDRSRMSEEFASAFPQLAGLLDAAARTNA